MLHLRSLDAIYALHLLLLDHPLVEFEQVAYPLLHIVIFLLNFLQLLEVPTVLESKLLFYFLLRSFLPDRDVVNRTDILLLRRLRGEGYLLSFQLLNPVLDLDVHEVNFL
jgi:hypothetical protein